MELSAEQFADIIDSLRCQLPLPRCAEQRRAQRVNRHLRMAIAPINDGREETPIQVAVRNVSPRGVGLICQKVMRPGDQFILRLPRAGLTPLAMLCTVIHMQETGRDAFAIGAEFTCTTNEPPALDAGAQNRIRNSILN